MNSGLKRTVAARGRLIHRSKDIERHVLVLPSGAEIFLGMRVSTGKVGGRNDGRTFVAGIQAAKRSGLWSAAGIRSLKQEVWHGR